MVRQDSSYRLTSIAIASMQAMVVAVAVSLPVAVAVAGEQEIEPSDVQPLVATPGVPFDVAFGVALTSDYVSRGITNSDSRPAIQGYIEPSVELPNVGAAYINVWSSNVNYGEGFEGAEIDVAGGIRPQFGPVSLDLGYVHYFYTPEHVSPDYGEIFAKADYNFNDLVYFWRSGILCSRLQSERKYRYLDRGRR